MESNAPVERRLAAIVATDVVGYSRLIGADEEGTLARLSLLRREVIDPALARHRGRIVKTIGDGLLIEFASVVEAVRCASEIQDGVAIFNGNERTDRRISLRIGINLGDIVVQGDDILGDGVNIAARLEQIAEPGTIYLSHAAFEQLDGRLSISIEALGEKQLRNIARPIRTYRISRPGHRSGPPSAQAPRRRYRGILLAAFLAIAGGAIAVGTWWVFPYAKSSRETASVTTPATAPSPNAARLRAMGRAPMAVLPFANLSPDGKDEYLSDGLTEEITDGLGRYPGLSVVAYSAASTFRGKNDKPDAVASRLGVRYLVSGSIRRANDRLRILVRLVDAEGDRLVWSQQFDSATSDIIALQDQITRRIVGALEIRVTQAEQERIRRKPTDSLEAYDLVLRGRALIASPGRSANVEARSLFQRAIEIDPRYSDSYLELGRSYRIAVDQGWTINPRETLQQAETAARKSIELDDRNSRAHALLGRILLARQEFDLATQAAKRALDLNPSDSESYWSLGTVLLYSGKIEAAIDALETARAYNPSRDEPSTLSLALAYYVASRFRDCIQFVEGSIGRDAHHNFTYFVLAMCYAQTGNIDDAHVIAAIARKQNPIFQVRAFGSLFREPRDQASVREGLRKIGFE
jgi:class 3 adenylate cyclase/TolB-like protein/cytochrome c-type biogenesis protein CcmH/NrfG